MARSEPTRGKIKRGCMSDIVGWVLLVLMFAIVLYVLWYMFLRPRNLVPEGGRPAKAPSVTPSEVPAEVRVASWNIRMLSDRSRNDAEIAKIADQIGRYDLVAVQESRDTRVLERIRTKLGGKWTFVASDPVGRGSVTELYAFFWNAARVREVGEPGILGDPDDRFIREPYAATFAAGEFDFTLLTIHLLYGDSEKERRPELRALDDAVAAVQRANGAEDDVMLLGDFNFPPDDEGWELSGWRALFQPPQKTTVGSVSLYDNIWFDPSKTTEFAGKQGVVAFDQTMYGDLASAKRELSDHRPVWAAFRTGADDDPDSYGDLTHLSLGMSIP